MFLRYLKGYEFGGWYTNNTYSGDEITASNLMSVGGYRFNLYVKRNPIVYTVTYEENGGDEISDGTYTVETHFALDTTITRTGHIFSGWYENADFSGEPVQILYAGTTENKIFYAKWIAKTFNVTLNLNVEFIGEEQIIKLDGILYAPTVYTVEYGKIMDLPKAETQGIYLSDSYGTCLYSMLQCPNCVVLGMLNSNDEAVKENTVALFYRPGKIFKYFGTENGEIACWNNIAPLLENNEICEIPACYDNEIYTISYDKPDEKYLVTPDAVTFEQLTYYYNSPVIFPDYEIKNGYVFNGWYYIKNNQKIYFDYQIIPDLTPNAMENVSLYLNYDIETEIYTINYELDYGNFPNGTTIISEYNIESERVLFPTPVRLGHRFKGWYVYDDNSNVSYINDIPTGSTGIITLYAKWDKEYTVTVNFYGWNNLLYSTISNKYINGEIVTLYNWAEAVQKCLGVDSYIGEYSFYDGTWTISSSTARKTMSLSENGSAASFVFDADEDLIVTLTWKGKSYGIDYMFLFGSRPTVYRYTYGLGADLGLGGANSHIFECFCSDLELKNKITKISSTMHGDITLYLRWSHRFVSFTGDSGGFTVTDSGRWNQEYCRAYVAVPNLETDLEGYDYFKSVEITVSFNYTEIDEGYQYVFLYSDYTKKNNDGYIYEFKINNGGTSADSLYWSGTFRIPIIDYDSLHVYYILFGASGKGDDDWIVEEIDISIYLSMKEPIHGV